MKFLLVLFWVILILFSCADPKPNGLEKMVNQWNGKEILFPKKMVFTTLGVDTIEHDLFQSRYRIISYIDSLGCISCKLQFNKWKSLITEFDSIVEHSVSVSFFIHPESPRDIKLILKRDKFDYPVCIDQSDSLNKLNHFSSDPRFQVFLLDRGNKVVAIGNPVNNPKIKELFLNIITGSTEFIESTKQPNTNVLISDNLVDMGDFSWDIKQEKVVTISNTGNIPLVINDVITSCGCITVEYNKEPVQPSKNTSIKIVYKADHPEHFNKTITVYCNTKDVPLQLKVSGNAK